jgi:pseudouridine-5'-phosphate glycosidase
MSSKTSSSSNIKIAPNIQRALDQNNPIVALESSVFVNGLPSPENQYLAVDLPRLIEKEGAQAAITAVVDREIHVGLEKKDLQALLEDLEEKPGDKISWRDLAFFQDIQKGGTTVSSCIALAAQAGISILATGGIGGVHRSENPGESTWDISQDLEALSRFPVMVISSGAKSLLNTEATYERLETLGIPVLGFGCDEFPAFTSTSSGIRIQKRVDNVEEAVRIARQHWSLGGKGLLLAVPVPETSAVAKGEFEKWLLEAQEESKAKGLYGPQITPFLLSQLAEKSKGKTLHANLALLKRNAQVAAQCAVVYEKSSL